MKYPHTRRVIAISIICSLVVIWLCSLDFLKAAGIERLAGAPSSESVMPEAAPQSPPPLDFSDDFNDNSLDTTKWSVVDPASPATLSEQAQQLRITLPANTAGYNGIASVNTYDLRDKTVEVEVVQPVSQGGWVENFIQVALDAQNYYLIDVGAGSIVFRSMVNGVNDQLVLNFDGYAHRYWGIRNDQAANTVSLVTSPDGVTWTTRKKVNAAFALTAMRINLYAGAWGTGNASPGAAIYDNLQVINSNARSVNVALAANGAFATASSTYSLSYQASSAINGDHRGLNWGNNGGWNDVPPANTFPDWLQIDFPENKTINEIHVFSLQDNYPNPSEPTESMTFSLYGLSGYDVQFWNGMSWTTVPGGSITGNNLVWRKFTFAPLTTNKIRVLTNASTDGYSRIVEVEAYTPVVRQVRAHWQFDEGSGTVANDSSGNASQGTVQGATWGAGRVGPAALDFNGSNNYVTVNSAPALTEVINNFTLSFWAYPRAAHQIDPESTSGYGGVSGQQYVYGPNWYNNGDAGAGVSVGTNGVSVYEHADNYMPATLVYQAALSGWTHITVVYQNKRPKLYVNGMLVRTGLTSPKNNVHIQPWNLGGTSYGYFNGLVDEVRIYKDGLTANEVQTLFASYQSGTEKGMMSLESTSIGSTTSIRFFREVDDTDVATFAIGGLRGVGFGGFTAAGIVGTVSKAYLYWHGPSFNSEGAALGGALVMNGVVVQGTLIGQSSDNTWDFPLSNAFRADVTSLVTPNPNKTYFFSNFANFPFFNPNGLSLVVLYNDGSSANDFDVSIYDGNDSNSHNVFDSDGWNSPLSNFQYLTGQALLQLHVADGQSIWTDPDVAINGSSFLTGNVFQGFSVPSGDGFFRSDNLWDRGTFDVTQYLHSGTNTLNITSPPASSPPLKDALSLVVALVILRSSNEVTSLAFEAIDSPLTANPNSGLGLRIFPDRQTAQDTVNRRRVRVKATTTLGPNRTVFFRAFDVDDPSTDAAPVDANGSAGNDNRGVPATSFGGLSAVSAQTDSNGVATVEFTTTMQPGDNFRVAASADQSYVNGLVISGTNIRDGSGATLPTIKGKATQMLTVWRNLHIEVDSMGTITGNLVTGNVVNVLGCRAIPGIPPPPCTEHTLLVDNNNLGQGVGETFNNHSRWDTGRVTVGSNSYRVNGVSCCFFEGINGPPRSMIRVATPNGVSPPSSGSFTLFDDDDFNSDDNFVYDGDTGENITRPNTTRIQDSDNPAVNVFAPAYVRPQYDVGDNNDFVPVVLNYPSEGTAEQFISHYDFDAVATEADPGFWTVYLLAGYECDAQGDLDPLEEQQRNPSLTAVANSDNFNGLGAVLYLEMFAEFGTQLTGGDTIDYTAGHELGHLFNGAHQDGGLMAASNATTSFAPITLDRIRSIAHP
jgi:hypothetical protein